MELKVADHVWELDEMLAALVQVVSSVQVLAACVGGFLCANGKITGGEMSSVQPPRGGVDGAVRGDSSSVGAELPCIRHILVAAAFGWSSRNWCTNRGFCTGFWRSGQIDTTR